MVQCRLADNIAYCLECKQPFYMHTEGQKNKCLNVARKRNASLSNMTYLATGFKMHRELIKCMIKGCENKISVSQAPPQGQYHKFCCEQHQNEHEEQQLEFNQIDWDEEPISICKKR